MSGISVSDEAVAEYDNMRAKSAVRLPVCQGSKTLPLLTVPLDDI